MNEAQISQVLTVAAAWANLLPGVFAAGTAGYEAFKQFRAAIETSGLEADLKLLDGVIEEAARRKQHEDEILNG